MRAYIRKSLNTLSRYAHAHKMLNLRNLFWKRANRQCIQNHAPVEDCAYEEPEGVDPAWPRLLGQESQGNVGGDGAEEGHGKRPAHFLSSPLEEMKKLKWVRIMEGSGIRSVRRLLGL